MKTIKSVLLTVIACLGFNYLTSAQKIAHINSNELLQMMPEVKAANKDLETYSKQMQDQITSMVNELQKKYDEYQKNEAKMDNAIKELKQKEIQQLQERIETFKESAQESVQKKEQEMLEPIIKKAKEAIQVVAKELGYTYVLDTSTGAVIMFPDSDNLMAAVKKKLGIAAAAAEPKPATPAPAPKK